MRNLRYILASEGLIRQAKVVRKKIKTQDGDAVFELTPQQAAALTVVPGGKAREYSYSSRKLSGASWRRDGGHPDAIQSRFWKALKAAGFRQAKTDSDNSPDGSWVSSGSVWKDSEGNKVTWRESYGATARDNRYSMSLEFKKPVAVSAASLVDMDKREQSEAWIKEIVKGLADFKNEYPWTNRGVMTFGLPSKFFPPWAKKGRFSKFSIDLSKGILLLDVGAAGPKNEWVVGTETRFRPMDTTSFLAALEKVIKDVKTSRKPQPQPAQRRRGW